MYEVPRYMDEGCANIQSEAGRQATRERVTLITTFLSPLGFAAVLRSVFREPVESSGNVLM